jgi:hypothetical protein
MPSGFILGRGFYDLKFLDTDKRIFVTLIHQILKNKIKALKSPDLFFTTVTEVAKI